MCVNYTTVRPAKSLAAITKVTMACICRWAFHEENCSALAKPPLFNPHKIISTRKH